MPSKLPETGVGRQALERMLEEARQADRDMIHADWNARVFLYVFHASDEVREIAEAAYMQFLKTDVLGSSAYPSVTRFARELVGFTAHLLGGNDDTAGHVTTGGTESIILALKAARGWAREHRPTLECPEVVAARPAHPTFDKAAELLGMRIVRVPDDAGYRADVQAMAEAITDDTVMLVGSAPSYWHGVVDPIGALGELAQSHGLWLHVDACLGGYLAPFVRKLGYPVPDFDLSVPGVRSISADLHKYGFAPKGASVLLMRDAPDATHHVFDWQDRFIHYTTPGLSGTRSGAAIAAAWAVMQFLGARGYLDFADAIMRAQRTLLDGIHGIDGLQVRGEPELSTVSFGSEEVEIFGVAAELEARGWFPNTFQGPDSIHLRLTPAHEPMVARFLDDLGEAVDSAKTGNGKPASRTGVYTS